MQKTLGAVAVLILSQSAFGASVVVHAVAPSSNGAPAVRQVVVSYDDLDPSGGRGAAALIDRIYQAADAVCRLPNQLASVQLEASISKCRSRAVAEAMRHVGSPDVSAVASAE